MPTDGEVGGHSPPYARDNSNIPWFPNWSLETSDQGKQELVNQGIGVSILWLNL